MKRTLITIGVALALALACTAQPGRAVEKGANGAQQDRSRQAVAVVDVNAATEEQLKAIPGIGDAYAAKIVKGRPYRAKNELVQRKILPQHVYDKVKDRIIAKQR